MIVDKPPSMSQQEIPKSLLRAFEQAISLGRYDKSSLDSFLNVHYLLFRTKYAETGRLPPSKARWLRDRLAYEKQVEAEQGQSDEEG